MIEITERPPYSAGHTPAWSEPTTNQVMDVLSGHLDCDGCYRNACSWALALFDEPDFIEDMPIDAKRQLLDLIANNRGTRYEAIYSHVYGTVDEIVRSEK